MENVTTVEDFKAQLCLQLKAQLRVAKVHVANIRNSLVVQRTKVLALKTQLKTARNDAKAEKLQARALKRVAAATKKAVLARKRNERIAKLEAKLEALRVKANAPKALKRKNRKASPVTVLVENGQKVA
jgi:capsule polysaccharide export protein KpsE/RkpR